MVESPDTDPDTSLRPLPPSHHRPVRPGPVVLCILDGVGIGGGGSDDAVHSANTPTLDRLRRDHPHCALLAHGRAVGLPSDGDMGNSEVGHNAMGAGRVFDQGAKLVNQSMASGQMFEGPVWPRLCQGHTLHLLGLVSDGNVHSHVRHLMGLIERAVADGVQRLRVHALTDGRDVGARTALTWIEPLEARLAELRNTGTDARIASGGGRMHLTMDRYEADWDMVRRGWRCHVHGEGTPCVSASQAIAAAYASDPEVDDQSLPAFVVVDDAGEPVGRIVDGDSVAFFNFRGDRAIEISRAFDDVEFTAFDRGPRPKVFYAGMMQYDGDLQLPARFLVAPPAIDRTMGEFLAASSVRTFACAETQKFGHVTFFFNGNRSAAFDAELETWHQVPSDTAPFEERPWMKAAEVTDACVQAIASGCYGHVRLNLANGDMVGHTGDLRATRMALEAVDLQLERLVRAVADADGVLLVTADHGNADEMYMRDKRGAVRTRADGSPMPRPSHTLAKVPFVVYDPRGELGVQAPPEAGIASVAATVLTLCGLLPPTGLRTFARPLIAPR